MGRDTRSSRDSEPDSVFMPGGRAAAKKAKGVMGTGMPRKARLDAPGALHHIVVRGIERRKIFRDDSDRDDFLERLSAILGESRTSCYAWALMPNHFPLLLKTGQTPISTLMRRLLTGYAVSFNLRHRRSGNLFQNRYKSILCREDAYLLELVRYIHVKRQAARGLNGAAG